jgi:two-component system alkaline phosphatase synthesis response regulator PhoP
MKKILVIDDSSEMLYAVDLILTHNDFIVKTTPRWSIVQKTIDNFSPDLILLDIDLDGADGGTICKTLKENKENYKIPVILFSAHNMPEDYIRDVEAQGFLNKPFGSSDLLKIIRDNLN